VVGVKLLQLLEDHMVSHVEAVSELVTQVG